jgi:hypothetical protein
VASASADAAISWVSVMRAVLDGQAPRDADAHHAEGVLRMLGIPPDEAAEIARRPLPRPAAP